MSISHVISGGLVQLSGNPVKVTVATTVVPETGSGSGSGTGMTNYKLCLECRCAELMGSPYVEEIAPLNGQAEFYIQGFADQALEMEFDYPAIQVVTAHPALMFNIALRIGEVYIDDAGVRVVTWSTAADTPVDTLVILKGKLQDYEWKQLNDLDSSFYEKYVTGRKFLTHLPNNQTVSPEQVIKLWYLSGYETTHNAEWNLSVVTAGLKSAHIPKYGAVTLNPENGLIEFSINPDAMGFDVDGGEYIVSYTFWLSDVDGDISERRTFVVDNNYYEKSFYLYYRNPLSVLDSIWMHGAYTEKLKTESEIVYRPLPVGAGSMVASMINIRTTGQRSWELNTGIKRTANEIRFLRDFLEARETWMIDPDDAQYLIPVTIEAGEYVMDKTRNEIPSLAIKIFEA